LKLLTIVVEKSTIKINRKPYYLKENLKQKIQQQKTPPNSGVN